MTRSRRSAKTLGTRFERDIADYLAAALEDDRIDRRAKTGAKDRGDISGLRIHNQRLVAEIKNTTRICLSEWVKEAHTEAGNDDALAGIVIHKRHGVGELGRQYVTMTVDDLCSLISGSPRLDIGVA
jgi:hypothetical protein